MCLKIPIIQAFRTLSNPEKEFIALLDRSLEEVLEDYIKLLLLSGFLAGLFDLFYQLAMAGYINIFKGLSIEYWRLINYSAGTSVSMFFFYLFTGTFLLFLLSLIIKIFVKIRYSKLMMIIIYSTSPLLMFSWIAPTYSLLLLIWCLFLLITGFKTTSKKEDKKHKLKIRIKK